MAEFCSWCRSESLEGRQATSRFCSRRCRQAAWRLRQRGERRAAADVPARFAYADPPYPGTAARCYRHEDSFAGEVDHQDLVQRLEAGGYGGWALSTSARALRSILPLCPRSARVCAWVKPGGVPPTTNGIHNTWEPLIVVGGRQLPPGVPDRLVAHPARGGGSLPGRKPLAFCAWLFDLLGMQPGDELEDLFPGTGIVSTAWRERGSTPATSLRSSATRRRRAAPPDGVGDRTATG